MATLREELLNILLDLSEDQFKLFKFHLRDNGIPRANLEKADRLDTVELMINKYPDRGALELTLMILKKISRNDLVERLQNFRPKDFNPFHVGAHTERSNRKKARPLMWVQQFAVEVTLDHDTAHPNLIVSDDGKQVHHGDFRKKLPNTPERFYSCVNVLGKQSFSSGRFYYEVQVKGKTAWTVGVAKESIKRRGNITLSPENGFWTMDLSDGDEYIAIDELVAHLSLKSNPERVGVFVDYEEGLISFYDVEAADHLYTFTGCSFTEKLYPFFSPCTNDKGRNSAPLIICPVKHNEEYERKKAELQSVQQFAVDVTLDTDTAHPALILSDDGEQVRCSDVRKKLPDSPKRFNSCVNVLGKQSFSSGRFYFEVQVKGKTAWTVGVAKKSIDRKGNITLSPEDGFWTVWLRNGDEYMANDHHPVRLFLNQHPRKVGVFVDYEEGLVSFYDVEAADHLYKFTGCSFTEKLYPFFSPCTNDNGRNSAPLIICPVKRNN
ncbi:zinc-binding protein A33-like isoform X2 [Seriola dumerili]|nr:zinc-binding protein A33-like isoform X2 [Seriola dumerili]